jgi:hypothetical protein
MDPPCVASTVKFQPTSGKKHISLNNIPIDDSEYDSERFGIERPNLFDKANNYYQ